MGSGPQRAKGKTVAVLHRAQWPNRLRVQDSHAKGQKFESRPGQTTGSENFNQIKPLTYKIDTCHYPAWCLALKA